MALIAGQVPMTGYRTPDYTGVAEAAALPAQQVAGIVGQVGDYFKQQGEKKKLIKKSDVQIDAALKLFPDLAPTLQNARDQIKDENVPLDDRAAIAESVAGLIDFGVNEMRNASNLLMKQQALGLEQQYKAAQLGMRAEEIDIQRQKAAKGPAPKFKLRRPTITSPTGEVFEGPELPYDESRGMYFDPKVKKYIADPNLIGTGQEYAPDSAMPTPTSQIGGSMADSIASAAEMNIGRLSTAKTPGTQGGNMGCADAICRTFEQATGEELVPGGTLSTREMATNLANDPRFVKVSLDEAQKGDIVLTPRKGRKAGHTGIVIDGGAIASNSSKGFAGKAPGTFVKNYTIDSWKRSVSPRNPKETAAYRYIGGQQMDEALAMGTPQQQTEVARMIEEGQVMAMAQNMPQGAIPTEPSMTTQQPQLPQQAAPQWSPPPGFVPVKPKDAAKKVDIVTGPTAQALNLDPRGTYEVSRENGNITGVQTITAAPTIGEMTKAEASRAELEKAKAAKDISIKTISEFVNDKGEPTEALQSAVGYGEALATGIAQYAPILGTQSGKTRSDQQRLARLVESSVLDAASLLKPVSNTDLKMLIQNRPQITDPVETWTEYFREIRSILKNPNNYIDSVEPEKPQTATQKLRGKLQGQ